MSEAIEWDQRRSDHHAPHVPLELVPALDETIGPAGTKAASSRRVADATLSLWADSVDDLESARKACQNRLESLRRMGALPGMPGVDELEALLATMQVLENSAVRSLEQAMKAHPLGPWVARTIGVGEKQAARLLAALGDPAERDNPSQLVAYCGLDPVVPIDHRRSELQPTDVGRDDTSASRAQGSLDVQNQDGTAGSNLSGSHVAFDTQTTSAPADGHPGDHRGGDTHGSFVAGVARTRRKGQKSNWSSKAKSRLWLVAKQCVMYDGEPDKNGRSRVRSPYRDIYDAGRKKYADAVHVHQCQNTKRPTREMKNFVPNGCGTTEHPEWGAPGSPLRPGHQHARALRLVMRAILIDLWVEATTIANEERP